MGDKGLAKIEAAVGVTLLIVGLVLYYYLYFVIAVAVLIVAVSFLNLAWARGIFKTTSVWAPGRGSFLIPIAKGIEKLVGIKN